MQITLTIETHDGRSSTTTTYGTDSLVELADFAAAVGFKHPDAEFQIAVGHGPGVSGRFGEIKAATLRVERS